MDVQLGCFNRPWNQYEIEDVLAGTKAAGYGAVGFMRQKRQLVITGEATSSQIERVAELCREYGLAPAAVMCAPQMDHPVPEAAAALNADLDAARQLGCKHVLTCGVSKEEQYEAWYEVMALSLEHAAEIGVTLGLKPHGGISATGRDLMRAVERLDSAAFGIWYDPGNIIYYTGGDPVEEAEVVAAHCVGLCVKDASGKGQDVNLLPGTGLVDFPAVFGALAKAGFSGPCLVECLGGEAKEDIDERARKAYDFLTGLIQQC
jgi:sugar phosphate isomerase/epimerase